MPKMTIEDRRRLLRVRSDDGHARVDNVELFFDLVFVFAVTQLSHMLLHHLTPLGAVETFLLLLAVWWVWVYTAWATNWLDPAQTPVRLLLFALMLIGLVLASAIPRAFEDRALWFAGAYVAMHGLRNIYMLWALHGHNPANYRNFQRVAAWFSLTSVLWLAGAALGGAAQLVLWAVAMTVELAAPALGFWTPGLGASSADEWDISGGHLAERCGLFVIIALGESVLLTGATFAELSWTTETLVMCTLGVMASIAMWWIYFNVGAERASHVIAASRTPGALARSAYTYLHIPIVAGIIVCAAADEIVMKHPHNVPHGADMIVIIGGPALFLAGCLLFKWVTAGWPPLSHMAGLAVLAALGVVAEGQSALFVGAASGAVLVLVGVWETLSLRTDAQPVHPPHAHERMTGRGHGEAG